MKVETTNLITSLPLCLAVIGIRARKIEIQVCDQSGSEVRLIVSTFITLIQYVYINRLSTDGRSAGWRQELSIAHEQMRIDKTSFQ